MVKTHAALKRGDFRPRRRFVAAAVLAAATGRGGAEERAVAFTFDDLPAPPAGVFSNQAGAIRENTAKLLEGLRRQGVPAVGFVNEGKLDVEGESQAERESRIGVLRMWLEAGFELGNHTYSHRSLNQTPLEEFQADVIRGEPVTLSLLAERGQRLRYFRHPFLQVGLDLAKRRAFEAFLAARGYTVAPVTIDNDDYIFAAVYADALRRGDRETAARVGADYLEYMESVFAFVERVSRALLEREPRQILLLHANALNANFFGPLAERLASRSYRFISLAEALEDEVFQRPDDYVGRWGISWLHHWELTAGRSRTPSPDPPAWVTAAYQALPR
jgi:peptidoglycan/xylan/chitin deacetylase (PgdA/CDA1 family)